MTLIEILAERKRKAALAQQHEIEKREPAKPYTPNYTPPQREVDIWEAAGLF